MSDQFADIPIGELFVLRNDKSKQLKTLDYRDSGRLPIVDQSASLVCGYTDDESKRYDKGLPVIVFGDHTLHVKFVDFDFAVGADGTQIMVPSRESIDPKYLYFLLLRAAQLTGSEGYKRHLKIIKEFVTPFTTDEREQSGIATILTSVDEVIDKTESQISKLQDLKKGMMQELLTKGIGHAEIKNSPVGWIPKQWKCKALGEIAVVRGGKRMPKGRPFAPTKTAHPYIRVSDFSEGTIRMTDLKYVLPEDRKSIKRYTISSKDLYISIAGSIGLIGSVPKQLDGAQLTENAAKIVFKKDASADIDFFKHLLNSDECQRQFMQEKGTGGGVPKLALFRIEQTKIPLPPISEQKGIAQALDSLNRSIRARRSSLRQKIALKKALMQDLLTGKVRVTVN